MSRFSHVDFQFEQVANNKSFLSYAAFETASDFSILGCCYANCLTCAHRRVQLYMISLVDVATLVLDSELRFRECTVTDSESRPNQCACLSANHMLPASGLNLKSFPCRCRQGRRLGCEQENRIAWWRGVLCASAAGRHRNPLRIFRRHH